MFGFIKQIFIGLLARIASASSHMKCVFLSNHECTTQPTMINLHHKKDTQGLSYYPFAVNLDRCVGSCNPLNDLYNKGNKDINLSVFSLITGINDLKTLAKHISCQFKCTFGGRKCSSNQRWKNDQYRCKCENN